LLLLALVRILYHWCLDGRQAKDIDKGITTQLLTALVNRVTPDTVRQTSLYPDLVAAYP